MVPARCGGLGVFPRLDKQDVMCAAHTQQDIEGTCSTASRDQYLLQSQESTPADSEDNLTSESYGD